MHNNVRSSHSETACAHSQPLLRVLLRRLRFHQMYPFAPDSRPILRLSHALALHHPKCQPPLVAIPAHFNSHTTAPSPLTRPTLTACSPFLSETGRPPPQSVAGTTNTTPPSVPLATLSTQISSAENYPRPAVEAVALLPSVHCHTLILLPQAPTTAALIMGIRPAHVAIQLRTEPRSARQRQRRPVRASMRSSSTWRAGVVLESSPHAMLLLDSPASCPTANSLLNLVQAHGLGARHILTGQKLHRRGRRRS